MAVTRDEIATVSELTEARARALMAERAALPNTYEYRGRRAELAVETWVVIDAWLAMGNE